MKSKGKKNVKMITFATIAIDRPFRLERGTFAFCLLPFAF
jgi:hypothetical protein